MLTWMRLGRAGKTAATTQSHFLGRLCPRALAQAKQFPRCASSVSSHELSTQSGLQDPYNKKKPKWRNPRPGKPFIDRRGHPGQLRRAESDGSALTLVFEHYECSFPLIWFRDICSCNQCVSESSGQKRFATCDIDAVPALECSRVLEDGSLELVWANDFLQRQSHTSQYPLSILQSFAQYQNPASSETFIPQRLLWNRATFEKDMGTRAISYGDWMAGGKQMATGLLNLYQWGLILLKGVPESKDAVKDIANKIGIIQTTFYGETWDVISKPNAENVAYTDEFLCLHQDLMYWRDSPRIQLLHCLKNDCEGGDSLFSDGLRAAAEIKIQSPAKYRSLESVRVPYHYDRNGHYYRKSLEVTSDSKTASTQLPPRICWSPPFQAPFAHASAANLPKWREAAHTFRDSLEAPENMLQFRLRPGDCVVFDNLRIVHGRTKFDSSSGLRHLHGAYLDEQTTRSALVREIAAGHITQSKLFWGDEEWAQAQQMYGMESQVAEQAS